MNLPSSAQTAAFGRHVVSYAAGAITMLAGLHIISGGDAATLSDSLSKISSGVAQIVAGVGPLIMLVTGWYASWTASHKSQVSAVTAGVADGSIPKAEVVSKIQATPVAPKGT